MKHLMLAGIALVALATGPTMAADLGKPAPAPIYTKAPAMAPLYDWTGFYVGLNGGYSWGKSATDYTVTGLAPFSTSQSMNGWVFGGQAGYNWQFNQSWLFGVEADIQGTGQKGTTTLPTVVTIPAVAVAVLPTITTTGTLEQKLPWFGTGRLRLGVLPSDHWLLYVTGGVAFGEVDTNASFVSTPSFGTATTAAVSVSTTRVGWTVGAGAEWVISGAWTAKVEYLYVDLGTVGNTFTGVGAYTTLTSNSHVTDNIGRVGINYRFGKY